MTIAVEPNAALIDFQIIDLYDFEVASHPDGAKLAETKAALVPAVKEILANTERNLDREAADAINRVINGERDSRSGRLRKDLEYFLDTMVDPENGCLIPDPILDLAFSLGTDGTDKTLRNWTVEDLQNFTVTRYRVAAAATAAAAELDQIVARVIAVLRNTGATTIGAAVCKDA